MSLDPGTLQHRIAIHAAAAGGGWSEPTNGPGAFVRKLWADIRQPSGLATIKADAQVSVVKTSIRIRHRTDIEAGMWILYGSAKYSIGAVLLVDGKREFIDLVCEEKK